MALSSGSIWRMLASRFRMTGHRRQNGKHDLLSRSTFGQIGRLDGKYDSFVYGDAAHRASRCQISARAKCKAEHHCIGNHCCLRNLPAQLDGGANGERSLTGEVHMVSECYGNARFDGGDLKKKKETVIAVPTRHASPVEKLFDEEIADGVRSKTTIEEETGSTETALVTETRVGKARPKKTAAEEEPSTAILRSFRGAADRHGCSDRVSLGVRKRAVGRHEREMEPPCRCFAGASDEAEMFVQSLEFERRDEKDPSIWNLSELRSRCTKSSFTSVALSRFPTVYKTSSLTASQRANLSQRHRTRRLQDSSFGAVSFLQRLLRR